MVQVSFDTNGDSIEELQHALALLQKAIAKRGGPTPEPVAEDAAEALPAQAVHESAAPQEETAIDTPFLKITVKSDATDDERTSAKPHKEGGGAQKVPTLNELLTESITEDELHRMFKDATQLDEDADEKQAADAARKQETVVQDEEKPFIEIIEYSESEK